MKVSFIHSGGPSMASYRYRAAHPCEWLGHKINDPTADVLVFAKPQPDERKYLGKKFCIADFCDDHFDRFPHYKEFLERADLVTCNTEVMRDRIKALGRDASVIPEAYTYPERAPHCTGDKLLWFGHPTNLKSLHKLMGSLRSYDLRIVSSGHGVIQWSFQAMPDEFARADIVILPKTAEYKSANRAVEAIRQGCFVVANHHPALEALPIWKGDIGSGIEWAKQNLHQANAMTAAAQDYIRSRFAPRTLESAWRKVLKSASTLVRERSSGRGGSPLIHTMLTTTVTSATYLSQTGTLMPAPQSMSLSTSTLGKPKPC